MELPLKSYIIPEVDDRVGREIIYSVNKVVSPLLVTHLSDLELVSELSPNLLLFLDDLIYEDTRPHLQIQEEIWPRI